MNEKRLSGESTVGPLRGETDETPREAPHETLQEHTPLPAQRTGVGCGTLLIVVLILCLLAVVPVPRVPGWVIGVVGVLGLSAMLTVMALLPRRPHQNTSTTTREPTPSAPEQEHRPE